MDPLGFGLETFDAVGAVRTHDGAIPVDASSILPDGRAFDGPAGLHAVLLGQRPAFVKCLTEKLLIYALGRGLEGARPAFGYGHHPEIDRKRVPLFGTRPRACSQ